MRETNDVTLGNAIVFSFWATLVLGAPRIPNIRAKFSSRGDLHIENMIMSLSSCRVGSPRCVHHNRRRCIARSSHAHMLAPARASESSSASAVSMDERDVRVEVTRRIKALGRQGKVKDAIKELANMARLGVEPDTLSATALIDACVRSNKMDMAESVFEELFGELLMPDEVAFMVLIRGYGDQYPPAWTQIASTLSVMEHTYAIEPSVLTFNTLLEICSKTNDEDRGVEIIDRMDDQGVTPNDLSFEAVKNRKSLRGRLKKLV